MTMTPTHPHRATTMLQHVVQVTTPLLGQPAVMLVSLVWLTWTAIHRRPVHHAWLAQPRRVGAHHALSVQQARLTTTLIQQRHARLAWLAK